MDSSGSGQTHGPNASKGRPTSGGKLPSIPPTWKFAFWYVPIVFVAFWLALGAVVRMNVRNISYNEFKNAVQQRDVVEAVIHEDSIEGRMRHHTNAAPASASGGKATGEDTFLFRTGRVEDPKLVEQLQEAGIKYVGARQNSWIQFVSAWIFPLVLILLMWSMFSRRMGKTGESILSFGKSRAKLVADRNTGVSFADVAGCDEAKYELQEVVDFLKNPKRYQSLGAKIPKGVLLVGPPGTGKTLLAKAVAGEARVPFFSLSGSDFVEMFVGVGAARVRDLFKQAKTQSPCIIFIDELDAIGRQRGVHVGAVNDEREQTLNQLLAEMDGFEPNVGIILLAATNRPEVLDRALLRPGRFDRQVVVDAPDLDGREAILKVHTRGKPLGDDVDLRSIARATPGFSGADLANGVNEAALLAARRGARQISHQDMEDAIEKVIAGPERKSRRLSDQEKRRVAYHEVGHALVAAYSEHADPVHKISIIPRGRSALGYTMQFPTGEQFLMSRSELLDRIRGALGGRAAEEEVFHEVTTGAENDLERATTLARQMVCLFGMGENVGLARCAQRQLPAFLAGPDGSFQRDCSEKTAEEIDHEVKQILDRAYAEAREILSLHRDQLERVTEELLKTETLDAQTLNQLIGRRTDEHERTPVAKEQTALEADLT